MAHVWYKVAGLSGASAVGAAAYGAHGFNPDDETLVKTFDNGNRFHLMHSAVLAAIPMTRRPHVIGSLFTAGSLLFCGSCYATALAEDRSFARLAPVGGTTLIGAWLALAALA
mmetsp:Transcript_48155/g.92048  ORF Transcript_48155/g.92048 Transcript_48155/m.92048 type:complete len:113 (+) Transcript_48155:55-393(+)